MYFLVFGQRKERSIGCVCNSTEVLLIFCFSLTTISERGYIILHFTKKDCIISFLCYTEMNCNVHYRDNGINHSLILQTTHCTVHYRDNGINHSLILQTTHCTVHCAHFSLVICRYLNI